MASTTLDRPFSTRASASTLLRLDRVRLGYPVAGGTHVAVEDASFDVAAHEKLVVIGPSGSGKSTLFRAVAGFVDPLAGSIELERRRSLRPGPDRAVVFQEFDQLFRGGRCSAMSRTRFASTASAGCGQPRAPVPSSSSRNSATPPTGIRTGSRGA